MTRSSSFAFTTPDGLTLLGEVWPGDEVEGVEEDPDAQSLPMVFLPGNGFPVQAYRSVVSGLQGCGPVYALNLRGIGGSDVPESFDSWDVMLADVRAYVEATFTSPVMMCGHSLGAILSMRLACDAPHLVQGLIMLEPVVRGGAKGDWDPPRLIAGRNIIERTRTRQAHWASRSEAETAFLGHPAYVSWDKDVLNAYLTHALAEDLPGEGLENDRVDLKRDAGTVGEGESTRGTRLACPPWLEAIIYETEPQHHLFNYARGVKCPAVLMLGGESLDVSAAGMEELARTLPVGVLYTTRGSHIFPMEHPLETRAAVDQALKILPGRTDTSRSKVEAPTTA